MERLGEPPHRKKLFIMGSYGGTRRLDFNFKLVKVANKSFQNKFYVAIFTDIKCHFNIGSRYLSVFPKINNHISKSAIAISHCQEDVGTKLPASHNFWILFPVENSGYILSLTTCGENRFSKSNLFHHQP